MKKLLFMSVAAMMLVVGYHSCSKNEKTIEVDGVTITAGGSLTMTVGDQISFAATVQPANATLKDVSFTSSDPGVATVQNGVLYAYKVGVATITATAGKRSATCTVTVIAPLTYSISASPLTLTFGSLPEGYTPPEAQTVTITNTGTGSVTLTQPTSTNFSVGALSPSVTVVAGATATLLVSPNAGLTAGAYESAILISGTNGVNASVNVSFTVTAVAPELAVPASLSFANTGGTQTVEVSSNVSWIASVTEGSTWLSITGGTGTNDGSFTATAIAHTGTTDRTGLITVLGGGITQTISVTQAPSSYSLSVDPTSLDFGSLVRLPSGYLQPTEKSITVKNTGDNAVTLEVPTVTNWVIGNPLLTTIGPGETRIVTVRPAANLPEGTYTSTVKINGLMGTDVVATTEVGVTFRLTSPSLSVPSTLSFGYEGGSRTVNVTSDASWTATVTDGGSWLSITEGTGASSGSFTATATANVGTSERTGEISVTSGPLTQTIRVTQEGEGFTLTIDPDNHSFDNTAGNKTFNVTSNANWTATVTDGGSWLSITGASTGSNNGSFTAAATANTGTERTGKITVTGGGVTQTISVTQEGVGARLNVSPTDTWHFISAFGETKEFTISSNVNWTITCNDDWLKFDHSSGTGDATVNVTALVNPTASKSARFATITFTGGGITIPVSVMQNMSMGYQSSGGITFPATGGNLTSNICSTVNWSVTSNVTWLKVDKSGYQDSTPSNGDWVSVTLTADPNPSTSPRSAIVTVKGVNEFEATATYYQEGEAARLSVSPTDTWFFISAFGETKEFTISSNVNWTVTSDDNWLTFDTDSGSGDAKVIVTAKVNTTPSIGTRFATITFSGGGITQTVPAYQHPSITGYFTENHEPLSADGGDLPMGFVSTVNWSVTSDVKWLKLDNTEMRPPTPSNNYPVYVTLTADPNPYPSGRNATVTVQGTNGYENTIRFDQYAGVAPSITTHPANVTVPSGGTATFTVVATGTEPLTYQWEAKPPLIRDFIPISGATQPSYTTPRLNSSSNGDQYRCVVTNAVDSATSNPATLTVTP
ncbi:MAG: Ig-like domain-containing protein [Prevotellaceae bacterium]|jgi:hypothetical protein|nr:Ig-like domain-containing protein [Prevotellaceae bacterium]